MDMELWKSHFRHREPKITQIGHGRTAFNIQREAEIPLITILFAGEKSPEDV